MATKIRLYACVATALLATVSALRPANGQGVSVNVGARGTNIGALTPAEAAGALPLPNWNDFSLPTGFDFSTPSSGATPLVDSTGAVVPGMSFAMGGTFALQIGYNYGPDGIHDPDLKLMSGFVRGSFDADKGLSLNVNNIPYARYDLYVYADTFGSLITEYNVNGNTFYGVDASPSNFIVSNFAFSQFTTNSLAAAQAEAASPSGTHNYVKFTGLTNPNLALTAFQANNGGGGEEGIEGFQIVNNPIPEPSTLALAGLSVAIAAVARRRRTKSMI